MPLTEYEVRPLFAEPYFRTSIGDATGAEQIAWLKALPMVKNQINLISENLYIFEEPVQRQGGGAGGAVRGRLGSYRDVSEPTI